MERLYTDVRFNVSDLKHGFDVVSDFSECQLVHLNGIKTFIKIMNYLLANEVGDVIRVINEKSLLFAQVKNLSSRIYGYKTRYVSSIEEAEKTLDAPSKRTDIRMNVNHMPVEYKIKDLKYKGNIANLSIGGCCIESDQMCASIGEIIQIVIEFNDENIINGEFKVKAQVVRVEGDMFAVKFKNFDKEEKDRLWKRLILKCQSSL